MMVLVWILAMIGVGSILVSIVAAVVNSSIGRTYLPVEQGDDELKQQSAILKKQADILEKNRMERWTDPNYFNRKDK